jgi:AcrR family transcriptional regulator
MEVTHAIERRRTGRPLSFNRDTALEEAMLAFWRHGYETTSIADLTSAMGITAPSLYAAFGDKKRLFLEAMRRYAGDPLEMERQLAAAPTARDAARDMLVAAATAFTGELTPRGCLLASATASGSEASADVRSAVSAVRRRIAADLMDRIDQDIAVGILPVSTNAAALSDLILAVVQGMSVLARDNLPRERLLALADQAMSAWPSQSPMRDASA